MSYFTFNNPRLFFAILHLKVFFFASYQFKKRTVNLQKFKRTHKNQHFTMNNPRFFFCEIKIFLCEIIIIPDFFFANYKFKRELSILFVTHKIWSISVGLTKEMFYMHRFYIYEPINHLIKFVMDTRNPAWYPSDYKVKPHLSWNLIGGFQSIWHTTQNKRPSNF